MDHGILIGGFLSLSTLVSFAQGAMGLGVVIFVHELGHFLVAKACGVKCEKFYVGFDPPLTIFGFELPRTLYKKQWGETEYGLGIIPLGGYVKMLGQDDNPANAAAEAERIRAEGGQLDPRSYPAKSVPQRMAIISAGVVFNLIFGILFASLAYKMGVPYTPTVIGGAGVGDPAWLAGVKPGDRIVALAADQPDDPHLQFLNDLKMRMFSLDKDEDVTVRVQDLAGETREITLTPNSGYKKQTQTPTIGVWMARTPTVAGVVEASEAGQAGLMPADKIQAITVAGERTEVDVDGPAVDLQKILYRSANQPITLHVSRRTEKEEETLHDVHLGVSHGKRFGLELSMGPVACVQAGSVADRAGMRPGDVMLKIAGQPVGDPLTLPTRILDHVGKSTVVTVLRGGVEVDLTLTPIAPQTEEGARRRDAPMGLDSIGIGYVIYPTVTAVAAGSPAAQAGLQPGDVLQSAQLFLQPMPLADEDKLPWILGNWQAYRRRSLIQRQLEMYELDRPLVVNQQLNNWPYVIEMVQGEQPHQVELIFERAGKEQSATVTATVSSTLPSATRGIILASYEETRVAAGWSEALRLGVEEVWDGMQQVAIVLRRISSNYQNLGGPLTIAAVATMEADQGLARLLTFLTMLSANLAILNFLPIPVLDGGHMVFLAYEGVMGKPVNERIQVSLTLIGFSFIACLMLFVMGMDVMRFLG